jgi:hypothetical protein
VIASEDAAPIGSAQFVLDNINSDDAANRFIASTIADSTARSLDIANFVLRGQKKTPLFCWPSNVELNGKMVTMNVQIESMNLRNKNESFDGLSFETASLATLMKMFPCK